MATCLDRLWMAGGGVSGSLSFMCLFYVGFSLYFLLLLFHTEMGETDREGDSQRFNDKTIYAREASNWLC